MSTTINETNSSDTDAPKTDHATTHEGNANVTSKDTTNSNSFNPSVSDNEDIEVNDEALRGDAIGETLYSQRFVLSTLLKLNHLDKDLSENEELEKSLCDIWDMTISKDVTEFLCDANVIDLFIDIIQGTDDKRLVEILVGIIGNLCSTEDAFLDLWKKEESVAVLLSLMHCRDSPTLIQLLRFMAVVTTHLKEKANIIQWHKLILKLPTFVDELSYMLHNSNCDTLLHEAFRTLNTILAKFALIDMEEVEDENDDTTQLCTIFATAELVNGTIEAFTTLVKAQSIQNSVQSFLNIHSILTQYDTECYKSNAERLLSCLSQILKELHEGHLVMRLTIYNKDVLETINDIFKNLNDPFNKDCLIDFLSIWKTMSDEKQENSQKNKAVLDFENDGEFEEQVNYEEYISLVTNFVERQTLSGSLIELQQAFSKKSSAVVSEFVDSIHLTNISDELKSCCIKLNRVIDSKAIQKHGDFKV